MANPLEQIVDRANRAREVIKVYAPFPIFDEAAAPFVVQIFTDLRHLIDYDPTYQRLLDASRRDWYRDILAADPGHLIGEGVPRVSVWRRHLETERMVGDYWTALPEPLKTGIVDACVDAEAAALEERLAAIAAHTGAHPTWNPLNGLIELPTGAISAVIDRPARYRLLAEAFGTVLDRYRELEDTQCAEFITETTARLEQRGYEVHVYANDDREASEAEANYATAHPYHGMVELNLLEHNPEPLNADAQALAHFAAFAEHLPPLNVDPESAEWVRQVFIEQAKAAGGDVLSAETRRHLLAALADAQTEAVNLVLIDTGYVWDPRIGLAVPLPYEVPRPLTSEQHAEVEAAKASVDPVAVCRGVLSALTGPVAAAFPAQAAATALDTGPTTEPEPPQPRTATRSVNGAS